MYLLPQSMIVSLIISLYPWLNESILFCLPLYIISYPWGIQNSQRGPRTLHFECLRCTRSTILDWTNWLVTYLSFSSLDPRKLIFKIFIDFPFDFPTTTTCTKLFYWLENINKQCEYFSRNLPLLREKGALREAKSKLTSENRGSTFVRSSLAVRSAPLFQLWELRYFLIKCTSIGLDSLAIERKITFNSGKYVFSFMRGGSPRDRCSRGFKSVLKLLIWIFSKIQIHTKIDWIIDR